MDGKLKKPKREQKNNQTISKETRVSTLVGIFFGPFHPTLWHKFEIVDYIE